MKGLWTTKAELRAQIATLENVLDHVTRDRDNAREDWKKLYADFQTVVGMLGNRAQARQTSPLERDPFAEIESNIDVFLSPAPGEFIDPEDALEALTNGEVEEG